MVARIRAATAIGSCPDCLSRGWSYGSQSYCRACYDFVRRYPPEVATGEEAPNHRNGHRSKTVNTEVGPVEGIGAPRSVCPTPAGSQPGPVICGSTRRPMRLFTAASA